MLTRINIELYGVDKHGVIQCVSVYLEYVTPEILLELTFQTKAVTTRTGPDSIASCGILGRLRQVW